jgi:adenosine kinase
MSVIVTGSVAFDYLMTFPGHFRDHILLDRLDSLSLSFLVDGMVIQRGGTAANIAYNLALLGERPLMVASVGRDFGEFRQWLEGKGVDTSHTREFESEYTASFFANTDLSNAQIASFYPGAMRHAAELSLEQLAHPLGDVVVISPNEPDAMEKYVAECQELGCSYFYDPSQQVVRLDRDALRLGIRGAAGLFANAYEFELLQKHGELSAGQIIEQVPFLVVTRGPEGATIYEHGQVHEIPAFPERSNIDPTGVGDAFRAGFIKGYLAGLDWGTCGRMGALAATYCLEARGPQNHAFTLEEFIERYRSLYDDQSKLDVLLAGQSPA